MASSVRSRASGVDTVSAGDEASTPKQSEPRQDVPPKIQKPGLGMRLKTWWNGLGLDPFTLLLMLKGTLPPTIILAMYQATPVAHIYGSLGYLSAIISIIGLAILPRAKFIQNMIMNVISVCAGSACALLAIYCATQARLHTTPANRAPPKQPAGTVVTLTMVPYNSSASVVSAVWLIFWTFVVNAIRCKLPQAQFAVILFSISIIVACCNAPLFPSMKYGLTFVRQLLVAQLTGLGVATGVSLLIIPVTCRKVVMMEFTGYLGGLQRCLRAHRSLLQSLEEEEAMSNMLVAGRKPSPQTAAVKGAIAALTALHGKLQTDLPFAKREIAFGKLCPDDLKELNKLVRQAMLPAVGLGSIIDILQQLASFRGWTEDKLESLGEAEKADRQRAMREWNSNMKLVHEPFDEIITVMDEAVEHVLLQLEFKKKPKGAKVTSITNTADDVESKAQATAPGDPAFASYLARKSMDFYEEKHLTLMEWAKKRGINLPDDFFDHPHTAHIEFSDEMNNEKGAQRQQRQRQLYLLLYMEFLLHSTSRALLNLVCFADKLVESGQMSKNRFIFPGYRRLKKLVTSIAKNEDVSADNTTFRDVNESEHKVYMGASYNVRRDPEHLPAVTTFQKLGDVMRTIPKFFRSSASAFAFRVSCAVLSLSIPLFLRETQVFSSTWRLFWALIMTAISMSPTSGQSLFGFLIRVLGTFLAMIMAWLVYYIPGNGNVPGMIVLYWVLTSIGFYFPLKKPQLAQGGVIMVITTTLIIGYELEAKKIGIVALGTSGQAYLPIYEFGPVRLATVIAGLFVAFVWTIFPYPISEHSVLRGDLGGSLYLLANYYSIVHETVAARLRQDEGDMNDKESPGNKLQKTRLKVYNKQLLALNGLKTYSEFVKWEIPIGGRFPQAQYNTIIQSIEHVVNYMSLISYASQTFGEETADGASQWSADFRRLMKTVRPTSHEITMVLSLLSAAIRDGQPLPPYLPKPQPYALSDRLEELDKDILSVRHLNEPGYAAFAVLQLSARCIGIDIEQLIESVKELVGELDFSFHVVSTGSSSTEFEQVKSKGD